MNLLHNYCLNHGRSQMNIRTRLIAAVVVALIVGFGFMAYDKYTDAEWVVSPQKIEQAHNDGQTGVETHPGTVAVRAIRSEIADLLPYKWAAYGFATGLLVLLSTRQRKTA